MKILYGYPYLGELGWAAHNWRAHLAYLRKLHGPFDDEVLWIRNGYAPLFPANVRFVNLLPHGDRTEGNAFVLTCHEAYQFYHAQCEQAAAHVAILRAEGHEVIEAKLPGKFYRFHFYKKERIDEPLIPDPAALGHWSARIESNALIFHVRALSRMRKKNTSAKMYKFAAYWAARNDRQFVTVGLTDVGEVGFRILGDVNLTNKTSLADLIAIIRLGGIVVGSSSGPMHLAALIGTPHVVWGGGRGEVRGRYLKTWNPFNVPVEHLGVSFKYDDAGALQDALTRMTDAADAHSKRKEAASVVRC